MGSLLEYHSNSLKLPRWGNYCIPLIQRVKILQKNAWHITHHTSHIPHPTAYIAYEFKVLMRDNDGGAL